MMTYHAPFWGVFTVIWHLFFMLSGHLYIRFADKNFQFLITIKSLIGVASLNNHASSFTNFNT